MENNSQITPKIKVFLADDHYLLLEGFTNHLLRHPIDVVETSVTLEGLPEKFIASKADVLVVDLRFNEAKTGLDIAQEILLADPSAKIILFSQFDDEYIIEKAYRIGILSFVRKDEVDILVEAIQTVAQGKQFLSPLIAKKLAIESIQTQNPNKLLTPQELRTFVLIADGYSPKELIEKLDLTYKTIIIMIRTIREKLGVDSYSEFTKIAVKYGLIEVK